MLIVLFYRLETKPNIQRRQETWPRGRVGAPLVSGASVREYGPLFRGLGFVLFRPRTRRVCLLWLRFCVGFGCLALAVVSLLLLLLCADVGAYHGCGGFASFFLVTRLVVGLVVCGGFVLVFSYSCA